MPVGVMLRQMSARELAEWRVIWKDYEVFGDTRAELLHGILCQKIDSVNRVKGKSPPPSAYMPFNGKLRGSAVVRGQNVGKFLMGLFGFNKDKQEDKKT